jgi:hypothetical protein
MRRNRVASTKRHYRASGRTPDRKHQRAANHVSAECHQLHRRDRYIFRPAIRKCRGEQRGAAEDANRHCRRHLQSPGGAAAMGRRELQFPASPVGRLGLGGDARRTVHPHARRGHTFGIEWVYRSQLLTRSLTATPFLSTRVLVSGGGAVGWSTLRNTLEVSFTRDVSTRGAFIMTQSCPEERSLVTVEFILKSGGVSPRMKLRGRVLRNEATGPHQVCGFAVYARTPLGIVRLRRIRREPDPDASRQPAPQ